MSEIIHGALSTPGYLLALLREIAEAKQTGILLDLKRVTSLTIDPHVSNLTSCEFLSQGVQVHR